MPDLELFTLSQLAAKLGQPLHRLEYAVTSRRVPHLARVGSARVYGPDAIPVLQAILTEMDQRPAYRGNRHVVESPAPVR